MSNPILKITDVTKRFGGIMAVDNINMSVYLGKIQGIIGPNGAGKTTLFNLISGIYKPTLGSIHFCGEDITNLKPHRINEKGIVRTFQNIRLFKNMTILDNVMVGCHNEENENILSALFKTKRHKVEEQKNKNKALSLLDRVGLIHLRYEMPDSLPYGLQRKLEIARALASNPKLLMLDEPAAGMNEQETIELTEFIQSLKSKDMAIMLIEHDMKLVMTLSDSVYVINHGLKIAEDSPEEIVKDKAVINAYLGEEDV
ncbi:ABC transporter ATP-binding protein [Treponema denticola]|jgi:high-affinity branched-chain amino acid ABC transporter, ATP-binding protein|uniref:ABC transporter ATP-binding protein n=1 Tax=Treponema denticola TaxID=158 RepID=UPI0002B5E6A2|nr:ABC transporter ATP-binding protein [Treponema denticola]EMB44138.1 hypothetical protein HMPREF9730_02078 [Treponema denticola AL-2]